MADNINLKLKLDGERDFTNALRSANTELKNMTTALKAADTEARGAANSEEKLSQKVDLLSKAADSAKTKVDTLTEIVKKEKAAQEQAAKALEDAKKKHGENSEEVDKAQQAYNKATDKVNKWEAELNKAKTQETELNQELNKNKGYLDEAKNSTDKTAHSIDEYGKEVKESKKETEDLQTVVANTAAMEAMKNIADTLSETFKKLSQNAYDAAIEIDSGYDTIIKKTGATGDELARLEDSADDIFRSMPVDMQDVGTAVGEVSTRFGRTGDSLTELSEQFLKFAHITDSDVNTSIDQVDRILTQYNVDQSRAADLLGMMSKRSQETGRDTGKLMDNLSANAGTLKMFGFSLEESVNFLAMLEDNGVEASTAMQGLKRAAGNYAKEGKSMRDGIEETILSIQNAKTEEEAWAIAQETFGTRGFTTMATAIREGRVNIDDLSDSLGNYSDVVNTTYDETLDGWDKMTVATNNLKAAGSDLTGAFYESMTPAIDGLTGVLNGALEAFESLPPEAQAVIGTIFGIGSVAMEVVPQIMAFVTQLATLKIAKSLSGQVDGLSNSTSGLGSALGTAAATIAGVVVGLQMVSDAAKHLSEDTAKLRQKTDTLADSTDDYSERVQETLRSLDKYNTTAEKRAVLEELQAEGTERLKEADKSATEATEELNTASTYLFDTNKDSLSIYEKMLDSVTHGAVGIMGMTNRVEDLTRSQENVNGVFKDTKTDLDAIEDALEELKAEEQAVADTVTTASGEVIAAKDASISKVGEELTAWNNLDAATQATASAVATACGEMLDSITGSIQSQINWFDELGEKEKLSADTLAKNLQDQINEVKNWEQNLAFLANQGINEKLLKYLADMGPEGSAYVQAFVDAANGETEVGIQEMNDLWMQKLDLEQGINNEANDLLTAVGEMTAGSAEAFAQMASELNAQTNADGKYIVAGMVDGIRTALSEAEAAGQDLGTGTVEAVAEGAETASPSRATTETGQNVAQGLVEGMSQRSGAVQAQAKKLSQQIIQALNNSQLLSKANQEGQKVGKGLVNGMAAQRGSVVAAAQSLASVIGTAIRSQGNTSYSAGAALMTQLASGINNNAIVPVSAMRSVVSRVASAAGSADTSGAYNVGFAIAQGVQQGILSGQFLAINAAAQMAAQALNAAKKQLQIKSPSRVFEEEVGKMAALGLAEGFNTTLDINAAGMAASVSNMMRLPDMSVYSGNQVNNVYVYVGDKELSAVLSSSVIKNVSNGVRRYGASMGAR